MLTDVLCGWLPFRYNDRVFDLLYDLRNQQPLPIREEPGGKGVYVSGLSEYRVSNLEEVMRLLALGAKHRAIRATEYNEVCVSACATRHSHCMRFDTCQTPTTLYQASSRSHAILQLKVAVESRGVGGKRTIIRRAKLNLVDLAGSEKWDTARNASMKAGRTKGAAASHHTPLQS